MIIRAGKKVKTRIRSRIDKVIGPLTNLWISLTFY